MHISTVKVAGFRNLESLEINTGEGINILYGANGSGKTNLMEAIFVLCLGRSQRGANDQVLLQKNADFYRLEGVVVDDDSQRPVTMAYQKGGKKKVTIDGVDSRLADLYENFTMVASGPEDSSIISGSPSNRRNFMDIYLSQMSIGYLNLLTDYNRILAQKNAALKQNVDFFSYNDLLLKTGSKIMLARIEFIGALNLLAGKYYDQVALGHGWKSVINHRCL